jgi:hypothetical protein
MKIFAVAAILAALYFLYHIAFPKHEKKKANEVSPGQKEEMNSIVGKSRVVLSSWSQPVPTSSTCCESISLNKNTDSFAGENQIELMEIHVPLDYENSGHEPEVDPEEEGEELRQNLGEGYLPADGLTFEEMEKAVNEINYPSEVRNMETAEILYWMENTECLYQLCVIGPEKAARIKDLINQYVERTENSENKNDGTVNFDIKSFIS